jgi:uncharacterized protein YjbJ (UPF0337 family)
VYSADHDGGHAVADKEIDDAAGPRQGSGGDLADDSDLQQDGQADRASVRAKGKVDELTGTAHEGLEAVKDRLEGLVEEARKGARSDH